MGSFGANSRFPVGGGRTLLGIINTIILPISPGKYPWNKEKFGL